MFPDYATDIIHFCTGEMRTAFRPPVFVHNQGFFSKILRPAVAAKLYSRVFLRCVQGLQLYTIIVSAGPVQVYST